MSHHGFTLNLCKDRNWAPRKLEVRSSLDFWAVVENRVSAVRFDTESCWDITSDEEGAMELKAFREDWWQPKGGKVRFVGKEKKPICVGIWSCSSNKLWWTMGWEVVDITSYDLFPFSFSLLSSNYLYIEVDDVSRGRGLVKIEIGGFSQTLGGETLMESINL